MCVCGGGGGGGGGGRGVHKKLMYCIQFHALKDSFHAPLFADFNSDFTIVD